MCVSSLVSSVQFSHSVMSDSLRPHGLQHARPPCPSPTPRVYPNLLPLSWWCHPSISFSVIPFSSCLHSFPALGSFQMSQLFASGSQNIGVSASTLVLPKNTQDWYPAGWTGCICLQSKGLSRVSGQLESMLSATRESPRAAKKTQCSQINFFKWHIPWLWEGRPQIRALMRVLKKFEDALGGCKVGREAGGVAQRRWLSNKVWGSSMMWGFRTQTQELVYPGRGQTASAGIWFRHDSLA